MKRVDRTLGPGGLSTEVQQNWYKQWVAHPEGYVLDPKDLPTKHGTDVSGLVCHFLALLDLGVHSIMSRERKVVVRSAGFVETFDLLDETSTGTITMVILGVAFATTEGNITLSSCGLHPVLVEALEKHLGHRVKFVPHSQHVFQITPTRAG